MESRKETIVEISIGVGLAFLSCLLIQSQQSTKEIQQQPFVVATVPGYRRAKNSEVTPSMSQAAIAALSQPLGTVIYNDGYALAVETHEDQERGPHKGVSVFLPEDSA